MWQAFHHPDISLPVIRRTLADRFCDLLADYEESSRSPLRWWLSPDSFESRTAYDSAVFRLRKQGLIVTTGRRGDPPQLALTAKAREDIARRLRPETEWRRRWNGIWSLIVYDVPESERRYRDSFRAFLRQLRLGCLQNSVWVSPRDIRPQYADLRQAAGANVYTFLFEARTVLGQSPQEVVRNAWDFGRLGQIQGRYCEVFGENLRRLRSGPVDHRRLSQLLEEEGQAYRMALAEDPLLPKTLWPPGYAGRSVVALHQQIQRELAKR